VLERARLIGVITDRDIAVRGIERPEPARLTARSKLTEAGRT
jgi:CBS domain-containing protein